MTEMFTNVNVQLCRKSSGDHDVTKYRGHFKTEILPKKYEKSKQEKPLPNRAPLSALEKLIVGPRDHSQATVRATLAQFLFLTG